LDRQLWNLSTRKWSTIAYIAASKGKKMCVPVYSPTDYLAIIRVARQKSPYRVHSMTREFMDFGYVTKRLIRNRTKYTETNKSAPNKVFFRYNYEGKFSEMDLTATVSRLSARGKPQLVRGERQCHVQYRGDGTL